MWQMLLPWWYDGIATGVNILAEYLQKDSKNTKRAPSPIFDHCNISGHNININNFTIVGREDQNLTRAIKEALFIRVNDPSLNRNIGKYHLPHIWDEVLHTSELKLNWPQWLFHHTTMAITSATSPMGGYNINHQGNNISLLHYGNNISHWQQHQPIKNKGNNISPTTKNGNNISQLKTKGNDTSLTNK